MTVSYTLAYSSMPKAIKQVLLDSLEPLPDLELELLLHLQT
jgi:hypothetical protein